MAPSLRKNPPFNEAEAAKWYQQSITAPEQFWGEQATQLISWEQRWTQVTTTDHNTGQIAWFKDAVLNACYNCVDRHITLHPNDIALIWEGNEPHQSNALTYLELYNEVTRFSNALKQQGIQKGDRVGIYLPMIPTAAIAMLACARIGAVHTVIFGGFSALALQERLLDADCSAVITADGSKRGRKTIALKNEVDSALEACPHVHSVFVVQHLGNTIDWHPKRDHWYHEAIATQSTDCPCEPMNAEDPLFILYTSGSTGKPKGVVHSTAGYLVYSTFTFKTVFDYTPGEVYWCTADVGWITGHSYGIYGPLASRATTLLFEGTPTYPTPARFWEVIDKHHVNLFYTAPTAIRALMREGNAFVQTTYRHSLRLLGTVGEPINPDVWQWYFEIVGDSQCPVIDTWWQTETGGFMITPLARLTPLVPGSATKPFFGVDAVLLDEQGKEIDGTGEGKLAIKQSWPGQCTTLHNDHQRMIATYLNPYPGYYLTGDGARRDKEGNYWITGRLDDVMNISGHRLGSAEVESALLTYPEVTEAAVISIPDAVTGEAIYAYVTLKANTKADSTLVKALTQCVQTHLGAFAKPKHFHFTPNLPKTRSGKIMRRILRKIASGDNQLGDLSTLADPNVIEQLLEKTDVSVT